ncbi:asparagine synthase-related protein [Pseudomonas citronellolis]|uniref:asparagine synthase-related protein n=1 Tax=Pseudomonas citronellolis TaxID=53408 RepID=UPI0023E446E9|nr:asparagine synthase-related protein [Pseudomonas citronellolis]MDF3934777.1 asparagine synthase-related protein [Pseudomonas citronellolis]
MKITVSGLKVRVENTDSTKITHVNSDLPLKHEIEISNKNKILEIKNPAEHATEIYIGLSTDEVKVSSGFLDVVAIPLKISLDKVISFLSGNKSIGDSIWEGVYVLGPGLSASIGGERNISFKERPWTCRHEDPAELLIELISRKTKGKNIVVRFSGGLESTSILAACCEISSPEEILAITWKSKDDTASSDVEEATKIANKLGVRHRVLSIDESRLFCPVRPWSLSAYPNTSLGFCNFLQDIDTYASSKVDSNRDTITLDGHGGDHIFWEYVEPHMLRECLGKGFLKMANNYCDLYAKNFFEILKGIIAGEISSQNKYLERKYRRSPTITKRLSSTKNFRRERIRILLDEIASPPPSKNLEVFYPFATPAMIECSLGFKVSELFDSQNSRLPLRKSAHIKFGKDLYTRVGKGVVTSAYQRALGQQKERLITLVRNGFCASNNLIDIHEFERSYQMSLMGLNGIDYELFKIIILELLITHTKDALAMRNKS